MKRADLLFSIVLIALGTAAAVESWRMPRLQELGVHPMTAPGLTPGLIGVVLLVLGSILLIRSLRITRVSTEGGSFDWTGYRRVLLALILTVGYAAGLVGRLPFWLATALFVAGFVLFFERQPNQGLLARIMVAVLMAAAVSASVTWLFEGVFLVRLP